MLVVPTAYRMGTIHCTTDCDRHAFSNGSAGSSKRQIAVLSAFVIFIPFSGWVMTLLQAVAGVVVVWRKKIQAVGGARQSLIRQVQFTWSCSLLLWCAVPAVKCKCVLL